MDYISTRSNKTRVSSAAAIAAGISPEGGLFVPKSFPQLSGESLLKLSKLSYNEQAQSILAEYLTDYTDDELAGCVRGAYKGKFDDDEVIRMARLGENTYLLELWHGPTCAFKDMALQLLPHLLTLAMQKTAQGKEAVLLVATSGDTGKAALDGFADVAGTRVIVFYPQQGISPMQQLQMVTQEGKNVAVCAIKGNFDDAQTAVKSIFTDVGLAKALAASDRQFSSANSINWGRLVPQIIYYISAYCKLLADEEIALGESINICVPTGNFGNILAAYYAKQMGLPVAKLICASNENNVLTDFIKTGEYNKNRAFHVTLSPSMDILVSSNLERLLFSLYKNDDFAVNKLMQELSQNGAYTVSDEVKAVLQSDFWAGFSTDAATSAEIKNTFDDYSYLCDPHTAVAVNVYKQYIKATGDYTKTVIASTASPFKFCRSVLTALDINPDGSELENLLQLAAATGCEVPQALSDITGKAVRFSDSCEKNGAAVYVKGQLGL
ncbi:MAG: threonine synthase [Hydrogenoanaerobacterium sp.]